MKSFAFGAAAALIAAYTVAETPYENASAEQGLQPLRVSGVSAESAYDEMDRRAQRGLPPFWGSSGVETY